MDHRIDVTRQRGGKDDPKMVHGLQDVNLWRDHQWSEH